VLLERLLDLEPSLQARLVGLLDSATPLRWPRILATASVGSEAELRSRPLRQDLLDLVENLITQGILIRGSNP